MPKTIFKSDARIRQDVLEELERHWQFRPAEIGVEVDDGVVTLTGTVSTYGKILIATDVVAAIAGVHGVANELQVHHTTTGLPTDTDIAVAATAALGVDPDVDDEAIEVLVRDGIITLRGRVRYSYQRNAAVAATRHIRGVLDVKDEMEVVPPVRSDAEIQREIRDALIRRIPLSARHLTIDVKDGVVTLRGNVPFYKDKTEAERAAWTTEGVRNVLNALTTTW